MAQENNQYKVLCWGGCTTESPCAIEYTSLATGKRRRAVTGEVLGDIPADRAAKWLRLGCIVPVIQPQAQAKETDKTPQGGE